MIYHRPALRQLDLSLDLRRRHLQNWDQHLRIRTRGSVKTGRVDLVLQTATAVARRNRTVNLRLGSCGQSVLSRGLHLQVLYRLHLRRFLQRHV